MPAYRSDAEAAIREPVVARLRGIVPGCRIIHEINACGTGSTRFDVMAVGTSKIAIAEIKSERDKLDRLPEQVAAMARVTDLYYVAIHERFLASISHVKMIVPPKEVRDAVTWVWPAKDRDGHVECSSTWFERSRWSKPRLGLRIGALDLLWRSELHEICSAGLKMKSVTRLNIDDAKDAIRHHMPGKIIDVWVCRALRRRSCVEADPAIDDAEAESLLRMMMVKV